MNTFKQFLLEEKDKTGTSFFTMPLISSLEKMNLSDAKDKLEKVVNDSNAREENKRKALSMIKKEPSVKSLMISASNFILRHPENNLGVSRGEGK